MSPTMTGFVCWAVFLLLANSCLQCYRGADQGTAEVEVRWKGEGVIIYNVSL